MSQRKQQDMRESPLIGGIPAGGIPANSDSAVVRRPPRQSSRSPRLWIAAGVALLVIVVAGVVLVPRYFLRPSAKHTPVSALTTVAVVRKDLAQRQRVDGTLGYDGSYDIASQYVAPPSDAAITQLQHAVNAAQTAYNDTVSKANTQSQVDADTVSAAQTKLNNDKSATPFSQDKVDMDQTALSQAQNQQKLDKANNQQGIDQARSQLTTAQDNLNNPSTGGNNATPVSVSWLPSIGTIVNRGQPMFRLNGQPILLFYGDQLFSRTLKPGVSGDDVKTLEQNLLALNYSDGGKLAANGTFGAADTAAVTQWQKDNGVKATGVVNAGDVVILAGAARIQKFAQNVSVGSSIQTGGQVLTATSTTPVVTVKLDAALQTVVTAGDPADVTLPNQKVAHGKVQSIATVADAAASQNASPTVNVVVSIDDPTQAGHLDQAPVTVDITPQSKIIKGALAVPIAALVALTQTTYSLEVVDPDGRTRFVPVETGVFDDADGLVQVTGTGIQEGTKIVMPGIS